MNTQHEHAHAHANATRSMLVQASEKEKAEFLKKELVSASESLEKVQDLTAREITNKAAEAAAAKARTVELSVQMEKLEAQLQLLALEVRPYNTVIHSHMQSYTNSLAEKSD
eukprot:759951-Prorocentrum_minimum.AAC.3